MTILSLSFAYLQSSSTVAIAAEPKPASAPTPRREPVAQPSCRHEGCDSPRRSPLYRALKDALLELTQTAPPAGSDKAASAAAAPKATASNAPADGAAAPPDLDEAVMQFARALMQTLRAEFGGERRGADHDDEGRGRGHRRHGHHPHHPDHPRHGGYADPAQRVESLARAIAPAGAAAPPSAVQPAAPSSAAPAAAEASAAAADTAAATTVGSATPGAVDSDAAARASNTTTIVIASIRISGETAAASKSPFAGIHERLLDAFVSLQRALGLPAAASGDEARSELAAFLQALADKLRGDVGATDAASSTTPGAMLSVTA